MPTAPRTPAYSRLNVDERRRRLLELGAELFTRFTYDELSMAKIAKEAGISKALLYHYFPSKQAYFTATLQAAAGELESALMIAENVTPAEQLDKGLDAFLGWIDANREAYGKLMRSIQAAEEVRDIIEGVRRDTANQILGGLHPDGPPPPMLRSAVRSWLWFMDGVCMDWIEHNDVERDELKVMLIQTLLGAIAASGNGDLLAELI